MNTKPMKEKNNEENVKISKGKANNLRLNYTQQTTETDIKSKLIPAHLQTSNYENNSKSSSNTNTNTNTNIGDK